MDERPGGTGNERRRTRSSGTRLGRVGVTAPAALVEACGFPEIGPLISRLSVRVDVDDQRPVAMSGSEITLTETIASDVASAAVALRELVELAAFGEGPRRWSHRIVALATATVYEATSLRQRVPLGLRRPSPLTPEVRPEKFLGSPFDSARTLARHLVERDQTAPCPAAEIAAAARALPLAMPTEVLLTLGGDHRNAVDWHRGVNSYGISPRPAPWRSAFGSCTASAPTERSFAAAQDLRRSLVEAALGDRLDAEVAETTEAIRHTLRLALGVADKSAANRPHSVGYRRRDGCRRRRPARCTADIDRRRSDRDRQWQHQRRCRPALQRPDSWGRTGGPGRASTASSTTPSTSSRSKCAARTGN